MPLPLYKGGVLYLECPLSLYIAHSSPSLHSLYSLQAEVEAKHYPRDPQRDQLHSGRVRVQMVNKEGEFCNELAQNSKSVK